MDKKYQDILIKDWFNNITITIEREVEVISVHKERNSDLFYLRYYSFEGHRIFRIIHVATMQELIIS